MSAAILPLAILATLCFLIAIAIFILPPHVEEQSHPQQVLALPSFLPRPPPARNSSQHLAAMRRPCPTQHCNACGASCVHTRVHAIPRRWLEDSVSMKRKWLKVLMML